MNPVWAEQTTGAVVSAARMGAGRGKSFTHPRERAGRSDQCRPRGHRFEEGGR